jgi:hypothetical protein
MRIDLEGFQNLKGLCPNGKPYSKPRKNSRLNIPILISGGLLL